MTDPWGVMGWWVCYTSAHVKKGLGKKGWLIRNMDGYFETIFFGDVLVGCMANPHLVRRILLILGKISGILNMDQTALRPFENDLKIPIELTSVFDYPSRSIR